MQYWKVGNSVESHSFPHEVPGGIRIAKKAYDRFIDKLPILPVPVQPDYRAWLIILEKRLDALESISERL